MTPFGKRLRELRQDRGMQQQEMATAIGVSPAYLSALEKGHRGQPTFALVQRIITHLNIIWDDAEELQNLARLSHPRVTVDTAGLSPAATELANLLALNIGELSEYDCTVLANHLAVLLDKREAIKSAK